MTDADYISDAIRLVQQVEKATQQLSTGMMARISDESIVAIAIIARLGRVEAELKRARAKQDGKP